MHKRFNQYMDYESRKRNAKRAKKKRSSVKKSASKNPLKGVVAQSCCLTEQGQHGLWDLVGLRQYRRTSLLQDLRTGHVGHFDCIVGVLDA